MTKILLAAATLVLAPASLSACGTCTASSFSREAEDRVEGDTIRIQRTIDHVLDWNDFTYTFEANIAQKRIDVTADSHRVAEIVFVTTSGTEVDVTAKSCPAERTLNANSECEDPHTSSPTAATVQTAKGTFVTLEEGRSYRLTAAGTAITIDTRIVHYDAVLPGDDTCE